MKKTLEWAISQILKLFDIEPNFYGSVTLNFQAGEVTTIDTKQTHKPPAMEK